MEEEEEEAYSHSSVHTCTGILCCISLISVPTTTSRVTINHTISDASFFFFLATEDVELPEIYRIFNVQMFGLCKVLVLQR
jgi:hypothetical protein